MNNENLYAVSLTYHCKATKGIKEDIFEIS